MENPLSHLRQLITDHCNLEELRTLCFDLGVNYDELGGEGLSAKAREFLAYLDRHGRLPDLFEIGKRLRPDVPWDDALTEWAQARLDADMDQLRIRRDQADQARRQMRERQRVVNLRPLEVTHTFKDRLREMQTLCEHLADASVRLVSIVGRGGMGKTALASRVLADLERGVLPAPDEEKELPIDGILYLSARSTGLGLERIYADVGRILGEPVASRLETRWADGSMPLTAKIEYLLKAMQDGLYLILLDNLEDNLAEDGNIAEEGLRLFVERCLTQPSGARLIATSREQVKFAHAALRNARSVPLREGLPEDEAVTLLRELDPDGTLGLQEAPEEELSRAARLTQGIPRALEILGGILHEDPVASLAHLLDDEELFGEQVVERLVAQGYQRLGENEQRVMEALTVFDRPVEETAITYLLHPWFPSLDVRPSLRRLVRGYFVSANRLTNEYNLHPLDRDYIYRQLPGNEIRDAYNQRNLELRAADFYANIRKPESEWKTIEDLAPQLAEFEHRVRAGDYAGAYDALGSIDSNYLFLWGYYTRLVVMREKLLSHLEDPSSQVTNLQRLGEACRSLGQVEQAVEFYEEALTIVYEVGLRKEEGRLLGKLGLAYHSLGQFERAIEFHQQALAISQEVGDRQREGASLGLLGLAHRALGQAEQAIDFCQAALIITRAINDRREEGHQLGNLGTVYRDLGQIERAISLYKDALAIAREIGDRRRENIWLGLLGITYYALGRVESAIKSYQEALTIAQEIGDLRHQVICFNNLGNTYWTLGQTERAIKLYEKALDIAREIGYRLGESYQLLRMGKVLLATEELSEAQRRCMEALALDMPKTSYQVAVTLGIVLLRQGDEAARKTFADSAVRCQSILNRTASLYEPRYALATALVGQAVCDPNWAQESERAELLTPALAEYRRALKNCDAPGVVGDALRDLELIRAAGVEGLEPVFDLLQSALKDAAREA